MQRNPIKGRVYSGIARLVSSMVSGNVSFGESRFTESSRLAPNDWRRSLAEAIRDPGQLLSRLGLAALGTWHSAFGQQFPMLVPESFLKRMKPGDIDDPLLRQVLPLADEDVALPGLLLRAVAEAQVREVRRARVDRQRARAAAA